MAKFDVNKYARLGAEARVAELNAELADIYRAFPALRRGRPAAAAPGSDTEDAPARRHRKPMTAAQRKAVSLRMKKYWAGRRKSAD